MEDTHTFSTTVEGDTTLIWKVETLIHATSNLPTVQWEIPVEFLDEWSWGDDHPSDHILPCLKSDLNTPILVWDGMIVDGCHRAVKALSQGMTHLPAKIISQMPPPDSSDYKVEGVEESAPSRWTFRDVVRITTAVGGYTNSLELFGGRHPLDGA